MKLRIHQAPFEETAFGFTPEAAYSVVWEEETTEADLEAIWTRFQRVDPYRGPWPPEGFTGRSLSIGDLIEIDGRFWTPVAVGFEEVQR